MLVYWNISSLIGFSILVFRRQRQARLVKLYESQIEDIKRMVEGKAPLVPKKLEAGLGASSKQYKPNNSPPPNSTKK